MTSVRRALLMSLIERYLLIVLALGSTVILARLLTPEQIGIYSVSLAVIGVAQVLRDFGIGNFLIQEKNLNDEHIRTAFGLSLIMGTALFLVVFSLAPLAGSFYNEATMVNTVRISSLNFLVLPFCSISLALLRREMQFQRLMWVTLAATVIGTLVTLGLAFQGFGPNSMAVGAVVTNAATGLGTWLAQTQRRLLSPSLSAWRELLKFGGQSSAASIVTTVSTDINDLALGKILGFAPVAILSRAQGLMNLFHRDVMGAVRNVAYPAFAQAFRNGDDVEARYIKSVAAVTVVAWPFYGFLALFALEVVRLMFGTQWDASAELVPLFCLAGALGATSSLLVNLIMAVGRNDLVTLSELIFQPLRAAFLVVTAIAFESLWACAVAYALSWVVYVPFIYRIKARCLPTDVGGLGKALLRSAGVALLALTPGLAVVSWAGWQRSEPLHWAALVGTGVLTLMAWWLGLTATRHPITNEPAFLAVQRRLPSWLQPKQPAAPGSI